MRSSIAAAGSPRMAVIRVRWIGLHPTHRIDAQFWVAVANHLAREHPGVFSWDDEQVLEAIRVVEEREHADG